MQTLWIPIEAPLALVTRDPEAEETSVIHGRLMSWITSCRGVAITSRLVDQLSWICFLIFLVPRLVKQG